MRENDLITRRDVEIALLEKGQRSKRYKLGDIWELNYDEIRDALSKYQQKIVRCKDCKNVCMCDTSEILPGIPIYAKCSLTDKVHKPEWFCADGERKEGR